MLYPKKLHISQNNQTTSLSPVPAAARTPTDLPNSGEEEGTQETRYGCENERTHLNLTHEPHLLPGLLEEITSSNQTQSQGGNNDGGEFDRDDDPARRWDQLADGMSDNEVTDVRDLVERYYSTLSSISSPSSSSPATTAPQTPATANESAASYSTPPVIASLTPPLLPPIPPHSHEHAKESQNAPSSAIEGPDIKLTVDDVASRVRTLTPDQALRRRAVRWTEVGPGPPRSLEKRLQDQQRIDRKNRSPKQRTIRPYRCPDPECTDPDPRWSNYRHFQDHLGGHDICMFVCQICDKEYGIYSKDYARLDNLVNHLKFDNEHEDYREQLQAQLKAARANTG
ncbi:hypothetical protein H072_6783 [Dactylellina haptotyla CBS 200.50]|uniref:Uncharacterized protein n=1 Tax=Dactylellina haptotyla (strain CBS 200.50) TaxID=1284197 RepID=S8BJG4_DACHA|nr:hypothetical protein H072_6783 [Dactylellina haptotyla CBS 200.50]